MTDLDDTMAAVPRERDFGGFLFWYVAIQIFAVSVFVLTVVVVSFLGAYLHLLDPQQWADGLTAAQGRIQGGATFLALLACIIVASAHKLGFWRGVGGWFAGNLLGTIILLPLVIATNANQGWPGGFYGIVALCLLYAIGSALAMIWKRRRAARALSERGVLRVFE